MPNNIIRQDFGSLGNDVQTQMLIAPVLAEMVSDRAYAVGEQFIVDNVLYKITQAVSAAGVALVVDSNCEVSDSITQQLRDTSKYVGASVSIVKNLDKTGGTGGELYEIPEDGYYGVAAITISNGRCSAYITYASGDGYIAAVEGGTGTYLRSVTSPIPFKKGTKIYCRAFATQSAYVFKLS